MTGHTIDVLYAAYIQDPEKGQEALLTAVGTVAKRTFHDDDFAQEFSIMTWHSLPDLKDLPCSFGGWIFRRLRWRRIDYVRASQPRLQHEVQVPEMVDEGGDPLSADEILDQLAYDATQDSFTELLGKIESIPDKFVRRGAQDILAGYTQDEIALRLAVNPSTLRSRLSRYRHSN